MKAYILLQAEPGKEGKLAREVGEVDGVGRVDRVTGPFDLIAEAEWSEGDLRAALTRIRRMEGALHVLTSLALDGSGPTAPFPQPPEAAARGA
jgi:hypothetical protein